MLKKFGREIWFAEGPKIRGLLGFHFPTRMAIIRLPDGGLFIWSPIDLSVALKQQVGKLGQVRHIIAPNSLHHTFVTQWAEAFPKPKQTV